MAVPVRAHTRAGGKVTVPAHTRATPSAPAAASPSPPQAPAPTPAAGPTTVPGGASVKPPQPVTGIKPHHFIPQTTQTVGVNPKPPATRSASEDVSQAPPRYAAPTPGYSSIY